MALLAALRDASNDGVTSFEYMSRAALAHVEQALPELRLPSAGEHHVLVEILQTEGDDVLERALQSAHAQGLAQEVVIAQNESQRRQLWRVREAIPSAEKLLGGSIKHDVSVPLASVARYMATARTAIAARWPQARTSVYGHVGDGNVHFNVLAPLGEDALAFKAEHGAAISEVCCTTWRMPWPAASVRSTAWVR